MTKKDRSNSPRWLVTLTNGKTRKTVPMPGGLHEAEARRHAAMQMGFLWRIERCERDEPEDR